MQEYLIKEEQIKNILEFLTQHKTFLIRKLLRELKPYENPAIEELKRLLRNKGKSSILESDIQEIIEKYKNE
jgi:hypothetical protein